MQPALFCGPGPFPGSRALEGPKVGRKPGAGFIVILGLSSTPSYKAKKTMADRCPYPFPPAGAKPSGHVSVFVSPPGRSRLAVRVFSTRRVGCVQRHSCTELERTIDLALKRVDTHTIDLGLNGVCCSC